MLYDPKRDVFETRNFASWLAQQPAHQMYRYTDAKNCAAAQYLKAMGIRKFRLDPQELLVLGWDSIVNNAGDETFGAAAERARVALNQ